MLHESLRYETPERQLLALRLQRYKLFNNAESALETESMAAESHRYEYETPERKLLALRLQSYSLLSDETRSGRLMFEPPEIAPLPKIAQESTQETLTLGEN